MVCRLALLKNQRFLGNLVAPSSFFPLLYVNYQLSTIPYFFNQLSTKRAGTGAPPLQLSTVNCQLSTVPSIPTNKLREKSDIPRKTTSR
ncbi:hypothetical protein [Microcoleus sp. CAWBG58]|uniref:hypothetical protein n=1 Tax=Microcoleus sp. CAWBG58 TaxID=2841651 RepID=UPI0025FE452D|nr:hypothetical protein [Microcoleus sp. CAWBG58]